MFAHQQRGARAGQAYLRPAADERFGRGELDDEVVVQPAVDGAGRAAGGFHQNAHGLPGHGGDGSERDFVLRAQQAFHPRGFFGVGGRVRQFGRRGTAAFGIDKGEQLHIPHAAHQVQRGGKILLGLAGEADDDVAGEGHAGDLLAGVVHQFQVLRRRVMAVHLLQQPVAAGLHRQVDVLAQVRLRGDGVDEFMAGVLGVAGHKADLVVAGHGAQQVEQVGKINGLRKPFAVAVDVLPQQRDFFVAFGHQIAELRQNGVRLAAALAPAHIGHDAVGTEVIAPVHDGQPGAETGIPPDGQVLDDGVALGGRFQIALAAANALSQQRRQTVDAVDAEHEVDVRVALAQLFHDVGLLRHAAADADDQARVLFFEFFQRADVAEDALLGMFAHRAGVEQDEVGVLQRIADAEADVLQDAADLFAVVDVLLAAVAAHVGQRRRLVVGGQRPGGGLVMGIT